MNNIQVIKNEIKEYLNKRNLKDHCIEVVIKNSNMSEVFSINSVGEKRINITIRSEYVAWMEPDPSEKQNSYKYGDTNGYEADAIIFAFNRWKPDFS